MVQNGLYQEGHRDHCSRRDEWVGTAESLFSGFLGYRRFGRGRSEGVARSLSGGLSGPMRLEREDWTVQPFHVGRADIFKALQGRLHLFGPRGMTT